MEPEEHADDVFDNLDEACADLEGDGSTESRFGGALVRGVGAYGPEVDLDLGIRWNTALGIITVRFN